MCARMLLSKMIIINKTVSDVRSFRFYCRHTYGEFGADALVSCSGASDSALEVYPTPTFSSLPQHRRRQQHQQQPAADVQVEVPDTEEPVNVEPTLHAQQELEGASSVGASETPTRPGVEQLQQRVAVDASRPDHTQVVVELHSAARSEQAEVLYGHGTRSSAPELHLFTSTAFDTRVGVARACDVRRKRQFVVVAVPDDVERLATQLAVHKATSGVRRSESCTLPTELQSRTTTKRPMVSLTDLAASKFCSNVILPQCHSSSSSQHVSLTVGSGRSSDQAASTTSEIAAPSSLLVSTRCDRDWRELSKDLWSLRALLANHEDVSIDESIDEPTPTPTTTVTTPQSADSASVKSSADTVVCVDERPLSAAAEPAGATTVTASVSTTTTGGVADPQPPPSDAVPPTTSGDDGMTRKPSIRRQNYREAIARRQNNRIQTAAVVSSGNELSVPSSSLEASSEPTDTESSLSFECCTYPGSTASSLDTTASSFCESMTSTDSTAGSDGHGNGHRLEQLRGDSGYRSLEAQQSLGQARDFRRQSASHFLLDSSSNVIYEDQMVTAPPSDDVRAPVSPSSVVVSVQQMQYSTTVGVSVPVFSTTADSTASASANVRSGHRHKAAQRKRIQRQAGEIHDGVAVGDPVEYKTTRHSHRHHHHHQYHQSQSQQQQLRRNTDADCASESLAERGSVGAATTTTTTTTTTTKLSLFSRLFRTTHVGSGSSASGGVASRRSSLMRMQRDYSIDERSNAIFNEFLRHDPAYDTKHTLTIHARSSRTARRNRASRSPMSSRAGRHQIVVEEQPSSTSATSETMSGDVRCYWSRDSVGYHTAPNTTTTSPLLARKHLLVGADPPASSSLLGYSMLLGARRRSEGSSRLTTNVVASPSYSTSSDDRRRRASTSADQPLSDSRPLSTEETTVEFTDALPTHRNNTPDVGSDIIRPQTTTTSQRGCQRKTGATSRSIPVIQLTTDDDTLP